MKKSVSCFILFFLFGCQVFKLKDSKYTPPDSFRLKNWVQTRKSCAGGCNYALLIGASTEHRHRNNLSLAYQVLIEYGYKRNNILILDSEGGNPVIFPLTDSLTKESFFSSFEWLKSTINKEDSLVVYITGHGQRIDDESFLLLNKAEMVNKKEFLSLLKEISPKFGLVFFDNCYWSSNIENESFKNYIFIAATTDEQTSYGESFPRAFWKALREQNNISIFDLYQLTKKYDIGTVKKFNNPNISYFNINFLRCTISGKCLQSSE